MANLYDNIIVERIKNKLNEIRTLQNAEFTFNGELGYYDDDWIKEHLGKTVTPFVLTNLGFTNEPSDFGNFNGRYAIGMLCHSKFRSQYYDVVQELLIKFKNFKDTNINFALEFTSFDMGVDFEGGDGFGNHYFEIVITFSAIITRGVMVGTNRIVNFQGDTIDLEIPHKSIKIEHGKMQFSNHQTGGYNGNTNNTNREINNTSIIVEAYVLNEEDSSYEEFKKFFDISNTNRSGSLSVSFGSENIFQQVMYYDGFLLSNQERESATVFLYFSYRNEQPTIEIDGLSVPLVSHALNTGLITEPYLKNNSNIASNIYVGKTRAYSVVLVENTSPTYTALLNKLYNALLGETQVVPMFNVTFNFGIVGAFTKQCLLSDIQKTSKDGGKQSLMTLQFIDGSDI